MSHLAAALFRHGRIETTLAKAKALRPFAEKIITLAKKAQTAEVPAERIHFRRLAVSRVKDEAAVKQLFVERAGEFMKRPGGYTRIYKLVPRRGDAAKMALIELIAAADKGYKKSRRASRRKPSSPSALASPPPSSSAPGPSASDSSAPDSSSSVSGDFSAASSSAASDFPDVAESISSAVDEELESARFGENSVDVEPPAVSENSPAEKSRENEGDGASDFAVSEQGDVLRIVTDEPADEEKAARD
jgi:large subunit ribosomal protein L17